jgi:N-acetylmuramoyl-L-alanine amidase
MKIILRDGIGISGAYRVARELKCDAVIELHFNAFNGKASGTETLCTVNDKDKKFAKLVQVAMCKVFDRKPGNAGDRGVKVISRSDRGGGNVYGIEQAANCLVEPFFGDNYNEAKMALECFDSYAKCLLDATKQWAVDVDLLK